MGLFDSKRNDSGNSETEKFIQIVEHNGINEANRWLKKNKENEIINVQCHFVGETTGLFIASIYKVTITYRGY